MKGKGSGDDCPNGHDAAPPPVRKNAKLAKKLNAETSS